MAEGCIANSVKYTLFLTNLLIFILGIVTLGFGIWVIVDKPSFLDLFNDAQTVMENHDITTDSFDLGIYAGAPVLLIVVAVLVTIIAFFGCFGALKESKCLLITYFIIVLSIFIAFIVGAVLVYQGKLESEVKDPLFQSIQYYKDQPTSDDPASKSFKQIWNTVQEELRCCGVNNATDWSTATNAGWEGNAIKPEGCCMFTRGQDEQNSDDKITECREAPFGATGTYYYTGCYTLIVDEIEKHQTKIFGASIGTAVVMFISLLFSFALCTMAD